MKNALKTRFQLAEKVLPQEQLGQYLKAAGRILRIESDLKIVADVPAQVDLVISEFHSVSGHSLMNLLRKFDFAKGLTYKQILADCAKEVSIRGVPNNIRALEKAILRKFLSDLWEKLTEKQREQLRDGILSSVSSSPDFDTYRKAFLSAAPFATLLGAKATGFAVYLAATTALSFIGEALGVTFAFAVYTTLTKALGAVLGPIGIAVTGLFAAYRIGEPAYKTKVIPCVILFTLVQADVDRTRHDAKRALSGGGDVRS